MRILIAEDDATTRVYLAGFLKKRGHDVTEAEDGDEAWEALRARNAPGMAIIDWMMPKMDGLELVRKVRGLESDVPTYIIMLSAKREKSDIIAGLAAGADDYIIKPFDSGELGARIEAGRRLLEMGTKLNEARLALAHEATHDSLTGTLNRRAILDALGREMARAGRSGASLTVGICDIDHFKDVNDRFGHMVGDEVLSGFTRLLQSRFREYDLLGRFGGEEFVVVTPGLSADDAPALYQRFLESIAEKPLPTLGGDVSITISIGVRTWDGEEKLESLLTAADTALYRAKREGRNRVCVHGDD